MRSTFKLFLSGANSEHSIKIDQELHRKGRFTAAPAVGGLFIKQNKKKN
jgi:hypothetical protein